MIAFGAIASLAFLNRSDSILLYLGPLAYLAWIGWPVHRARLATYFAIALAPVALWLVFSYVYYGFPFPNTYYAKVATGIPRSLQLRQGLAYVANSINFDPFTLGLIGLTCAVAAHARRLPEIAAAVSALLYVLYTISVGGDFMSGRFFAMPLLVCAIVLVRMVQRREMGAALGAALVAYNVIAPLAPVKTRANYPDGAWAWRLQNGIKDERGHYHQISNVLFYAPFRALPDHLWYREGISFRNSPEKVSVQGSIGFFGFAAGPTKYVIDRNALSDPLLARLPVSESLYFEFYSGHFFRELPNGYLESRREGRNLLVDPLLHDYYDKLLNVTAGPVFSWARAQRHLGPELRPLPSNPRARDRTAPGVCLRGGRQRAVFHGYRRTQYTRRGHADRLGSTRGLPADGSEHSSEGRSFQGPLGRHDTGGTRRTAGRRRGLDRRRALDCQACRVQRRVFVRRQDSGRADVRAWSNRRPISSTACSCKKA